MKMKMKTLVAGVLAITMLTVTVAMTMSAVPEPPNPSRSPLQGTWQVVVTPDVGDPFVDITTYDAHGGIVNLDFAFGVSIGESFRVGPHTFEGIFHGFTGPETRFQVTGTTTLDGPNTFSGPFVTEFFDLDGTLLGAFVGTVTGTRL